MIYKATMTGCHCTIFAHNGWWGIKGTYGLSQTPRGYLLSDGIDTDKIPQNDYQMHDTPIRTERQVVDLVKSFPRAAAKRGSIYS
jgi:hypothetical protein